MIFYEAPHKLRATLSDLCEVFGAERRIALVRELTKLNEQIVRTTLAEAADLFAEREGRGEYVLIVEGEEEACGGARPAESDALCVLSLQEHLDHYLEQGLSRMDAIKAVAKDRHVGKSEIYKQLCCDE